MRPGTCPVAAPLFTQMYAGALTLCAQPGTRALWKGGALGTPEPDRVGSPPGAGRGEGGGGGRRCCAEAGPRRGPQPLWRRGRRGDFCSTRTPVAAPRTPPAVHRAAHKVVLRIPRRGSRRAARASAGPSALAREDAGPGRPELSRVPRAGPQGPWSEPQLLPWPRETC